ncbi:unnamed protein product [Strongylus vulgaris]|uniref:Uncharacterized protein n=1 Tax=Strongylus vulgaris TaxID=40348 RepID=A0A3P7KGT3_STRVU|nr:unnamed protein product [Strongylus vulgaris]
MLGGRVKTLHPAVHGGILARDTEQDRQEMEVRGLWADECAMTLILHAFRRTLVCLEILIIFLPNHLPNVLGSAIHPISHSCLFQQ